MVGAQNVVQKRPSGTDCHVFPDVVATLQPTPLVWGLAVEQTEECRLQRFGNGTALARADLDVIHGSDGGNFRRRARQENLVGQVQQFTR